MFDNSNLVPGGSIQMSRLQTATSGRNGAQSAPSVEAAQSAPGAYPKRWAAAVVMIVGALMDMVDVTIVNVALPTIRRDLHTTATQLEWVVSGYMLAFAAALIIAGNLGDVLGRKRVFLIGVSVFGLASLAAGISASGPELIAARIVQGAAAAAMAPQVLATFRAMFAAGERGKAFGMYGAMLGFASAIGLILGGVLTEANLFGWSWRAVFFVNIPVAAIALIAGARMVPETRDVAAKRPNLPGALLLAASLLAIVYPLLEGRQLGWPGWVWAVFAAGLAGLAALGVIEARHGGRRFAPLLRARLLRIPAFAAGQGIQLAFSVGMQGFFLMFALWLQIGEQFSPLKAGLTAVAFSVGSFLVAPFAAPLAQRHGWRVLASGAALMVAGIGGIAFAAPHIGVHGSPWPVVPGLVVAGAGLSLLVIPLVNVVLAAVPVEVAGGASGLFGTAQQLGGAIGVALFGTVFFGYVSGHSFEAALVHTAPYAMGAFAICGLFAVLLPRTAVGEEEATSV
jgi:EmrB/QacA subfamily drug resistance transporter